MTCYEDIRMKRNEVSARLEKGDYKDAQEEQFLNNWLKELSLACEDAYRQEIMN